MKVDNNIDEILQKGLETFNPTPPVDVWANIEYSLGQTNVGSDHTQISKAAKAFKAIKSAGILTKLAAFAILPAFIGVYFIRQAAEVTTKSQTPQVTELNANQNNVEPKAMEQETTTLHINKEIPKRTKPALKEISSTLKVNSLKAASVNTGVITESKTGSYQDSKQTPQTAVKEDKITTAIQTITKEDKEKWDETILKLQLANDTVTIKEDAPVEEPKFSNVITPNGDGFNDKFEFEHIKNINSYHLLIYDKTGNIVFESFQSANNWNGTHFKTGEECAVGFYKFTFDYQMNNNLQNIHTKRGTINLLR